MHVAHTLSDIVIRVLVDHPLHDLSSPGHSRDVITLRGHRERENACV